MRLDCLPFIREKSRFPTSLLLRVGSWFRRPRPHVIYPATSPTNYSLNTAAENLQLHTLHSVHSHSHTHTRGSELGRGGMEAKKNRMHSMGDCVHMLVFMNPFWLHLPMCGQIHVWDNSTILKSSCAHFLPICMTRPKTEELSTVLQFQRRCLNWYWHSRMPVLAPSPMYCM